MADINKTIKDIEECLSASCRGYKPKVYCPHTDEEWDIMRDALELLKEQQKQWKPVNAKGNYICGCCGNPLHTAIINPMIQFCDHCGYKVDWSKDGEA